MESRAVCGREGERFDGLWFLQRDLAGAETLRASARIFEQQRAVVVDADDGARMAGAAFENGDVLTAQDIEAVPEIGEGFDVVAVEETLVSEQDPPDDRGGEAVEIDGRADEFGEGHGALAEVTGPR